MEETESTVIIPGLPNELSLSCLARIPSGRHPIARRVSRSWRDALTPSVMEETRRRCGISETKVFACLTHIEGQRRCSTWFLLDPLISSCKSIPPPPLRQPNAADDNLIDIIDGDADAPDVFSGCIELDGRQVLFVASPSCSHLFGLDTLPWKWKSLQFPTGVIPSGCASGWLGGYLYIAGGLDEEQGPLKSAKRVKVENGVVESIKHMSDDRGNCTGIVFKGLFCVIGGWYNVGVITHFHSSAEIWDPLSEKWTIVPEMWPRKIFGRSQPPMVAVSSDQLYAVKPQKWELMWYDSDINTWKSLSRLPFELCNPHFPYVFGAFYITRLIGVGKELWVTVHCANDMFVLACEPSVKHHFTWRRLAFTFSDFTSISAGVAITM